MEVIATILASAITGICTVIGVVITNSQSNKKVEQQIVTSQAVTDTKIENLTMEVRRHNNFAVKIPAIEQDLHNIHHELDRLGDK